MHTGVNDQLATSPEAAESVRAAIDQPEIDVPEGLD
jgi:hypothetical protein